jgi:transposase
MSVLDQFRDAEQRVAQRLKELEPAVAEYRELEVVAQRLGIDSATVTAESAPAARAGRASRRRRPRTTAATKTAGPTRTQSRSRRRTASGGREQQLLELVRARPGITVREVGQEFGVDPTSLYRVVHRLEKSGQVRKNGRALEPVAS